jgi:hypothetical protein
VGGNVDMLIYLSKHVQWYQIHFDLIDNLCQNFSRIDNLIRKVLLSMVIVIIDTVGKFMLRF